MHQYRSAFQGGWALSLLIAGCGIQENEGGPDFDVRGAQVAVWAEPKGLEFQSTAEVSLASSSPAHIFYTVDGSEPSGDTAVAYDGPIQLTESTLLSFIAITDTEEWSEPGSEFYSRLVTHEKPRPVEHALTIDNDSLFFSAQQGSTDLVVRRIGLRSEGLSTVTIDGMMLRQNPNGSSFWSNGAFSYEILTDGNFPLFVPSGTILELEVTYTPTESLSSAAIFIESDDELHGDELVIELWGRTIDW
jgi:hypothetical protein